MTDDERGQKWSRLAYHLGMVNIALFGWALLLYSGGLTGIVQMVLGIMGLGLTVVGLVLLLIIYAEYLFDMAEPRGD